MSLSYQSSEGRLTKDQKEAIGLLSIGTFLEYFDLMLYVHMAVLLNELFFPKTDPQTTALLSAFAFCSTYVLRPLGALVFGYIGDVIGRKSTVIITTGLMAVSCLIMANLPTYSQMGIAVSWIVTSCRIVQGMSSMGEITGAQLFLCETIKPPARHPAVAGLNFSIAIGTSAALGIASLVTSDNFDWRIAFWIGALIAVIGATARTRLRETPEFADAKRRIKDKITNLGMSLDVTNSNLIYKEKPNKKTALALFLLDCMWPLCFYFVYVHCGNILKNQFHYRPEQVIHQNLIVSIAQVLNCLAFVILSYRIYPLLILKVKLVISFLLFITCPYFLTHMKSPESLLFIQSAIIFFACDSSPATSIFYRYFPIFKRFTYIGFLYALSRALTYIITSFGFVYLVGYFGNYGTLFIMMPICIGYFYGLRYFEQLERASQ
jgi:MHS family proline/betaine transporter-like MFS transporter